MFGGEIMKTLDTDVESKNGSNESIIKIHLIKPKNRPEEPYWNRVNT